MSYRVVERGGEGWGGSVTHIRPTPIRLTPIHESTTKKRHTHTHTHTAAVGGRKGEGEICGVDGEEGENNRAKRVRSLSSQHGEHQQKRTHKKKNKESQCMRSHV